MASLVCFKVFIDKFYGFPFAVMLLFECGLADSVLTAQNVAKYGLDIEGNPLLKKIMGHWGVLPLSLIHISEPTRQPATSRMPSSA